ncbi:hypothetical protein [Enterobacter cancerogenus]|uniref:hypothetical protein n=1 Tax=Enterobacter cancerogenus TaxID=69218 RepID=UPI0012D2EE9D|nr:hypothetical protein [Enterobacter cancerogenus]
MTTGLATPAERQPFVVCQFIVGGGRQAEKPFQGRFRAFGRQAAVPPVVQAETGYRQRRVIPSRCRTSSSGDKGSDGLRP